VSVEDRQPEAAVVLYLNAQIRVSGNPKVLLLLSIFLSGRISSEKGEMKVSRNIAANSRYIAYLR
jgi:hypothetical protein